MERQQITSSYLKSVGYEKESHTLEIEFISGKVFQYLSFPEELYKNFNEASSKGKFFTQNIRGTYTGVEV
jgi:hypothetical protein